MSIAQVECTRCEHSFEVDTEYFRRYGADPFCADCLIHTVCYQCNRGLRLQPSRYQELNGDPVVCTDCDPQPEIEPPRAPTETPSFWQGLTTGEKVLFPLVVLIGLVAIGATLVDPATPTTDVSRVVATCAIIAVWIYSRGRKNKIDE
ncbi:hypothetical protein SAMN05421809_0633 [Natronorubrum daqingense]|uniref:Uncharacterized protein n=1 Tax=Natronorubrum daqingense TaxID=588898 RepID=A0A1N6Z0Z9_9EURY|nr:hypothetical protein BB347_02090 [Natronorubrum daqingense]SIR20411.1 hypothetical protein SAMN05421809_0633 [Natronorubrum daqingense]